MNKLSEIRRGVPVRYEHPVLAGLVRLIDRSGRQSDLAEQVGYAQSSLSSFRLGRRTNPRFRMLVDLAEHFGYEIVLRRKE